jgi:hypothetical protein
VATRFDRRSFVLNTTKYFLGFILGDFSENILATLIPLEGALTEGA